MANPPVPQALDKKEAAVELPQPIDGNTYRYIPHEEIEALFFSGQQDKLLSQGQLTWVCKSKGRKHKQKQKQQGSTSTDTDDQKNHSSSRTDETAKSEQRLELFLRARVLESAVEHQGQPPPRVRVQYPAGSTYAVQRNHLVPVLEKTRNLVLVLPETDLYRRCCVVHTLPDESFMEIGCDNGITLNRVWETGDAKQEESARRRQVVGIDKSVVSIREAKERYPDLCKSFFVWDVLAEPVKPAEMLISHSQPPDVVAMDINGNRELLAVLECLQAVWKLWRPRLIIVKSRSLYAVVTGTQEK